MPSGMTIPMTFQIYKGDELIGTQTLTQDIIKIGKLSSSHLRIDDESVSRMHAVIEISGQSDVFIIDLGSTKGTLVNGQKVNKAKLQSGDIVMLGDTKVIVTIGEPQPVAVAAPAAGQAPFESDGPTQIQAVEEQQPLIRQTATVMGMPAAVPPPPGIAPPQPAAAPVPAPMAPRAPAPTARAPQAGGTSGAAMMSAPAAGGPRGIDTSAVELQDGSRAVEVAAMFEDAVIDVKHFSNPSATGVTGMTKGLLAAGGASLVAALILFIVAYTQVAAIKHAKEQWEQAGKPMNEFIVPREGPIKDILASVFVIFGLYGLLHGMARLHEERQPREYTIGPDGDALFNAPGELLPMPSFPLVRSTGSDYEVTFTKDMQGDLTVTSAEQAGGPYRSQPETLEALINGGKARSSSVVPGAFAMALPPGGRLKLDLGSNTFLVSSVPPPRRYSAPLAIDWGQQAYTGAMALLWGGFLGMVFSIPPDPKSLSLDAFMNDQRFAKFLIKPPEEKEEQIPEWLKKKGPDEAGGKGKRHKGEEGKMGKKTSKNKAGLYGLKGPKDNPDPHLAKMLAEEAASKAGVLGMLKANEGSHLASIFGRDSALGNDAENVLGGLVGTQIGEAYGVGGLGLVGSGRGGGGTGEGTIGLGSLGTIGKGGGGGSGSGYGRGAGGLGGRRASAPDVVPGTAQVRGSLDKEIIRRVIRRHLNEVKFCYEKELMHKSDLYGRVMIQFTIAGTGQVIASVVQNSTMNSPNVEQCIAGAVRRWEFPKPQGGGIVVVSYPFVLKAAGAE